MTKNKSRLAMLAAVTVYILWGFTFLASAVGQKYATPFVLLAWRFDTAALLMALPIIFGRAISSHFAEKT